MTSSASPSFTPFKSPFSVFSPTTLFIAASVGIHALVLGLVLPNVKTPAPSTSNENRQNVSLIELNEAEQSRLPDLSPQTFDPSDFDLPQLNLPDSTTSRIELDPSAIQSALPNLPPPPPSLPPLNYSRTPSITITPRSIPPISPRRIPTPPPSYRSSLPSPPPSQSNLSNLPSLPSQRTRPNFGQLREPIPADELINRRFEPPELPQNPERVAVNSPNRTNPQENTPIQPQIDPEKIRAQQIQEQRMRRLVAQTIQGANSLRYEEENTSADDAMRNNVTWMNKVGEVKPKSKNLSGNYPKAACFRKLEGTAVYGVSVNGQGRMSQQPYLIKSSGYPVLNQQALRQIQASRFENGTGQVQPYRVTVNFQYDSKVCPSVGVVEPNKPQSPSETPSQPAVAPQNPAPSAIQQAPEPVESQPIQVQPAPNPSAIQQAPQPQPIQVQPAPKPQNQPSAPSAIQQAPKPEPVESQPTQENLAPNPSAIQQAPKPDPIDIQPAPKPENQPPAPSAIRKPPQSQPKDDSTSVKEETVPLGTMAPRKSTP